MNGGAAAPPRLWKMGGKVVSLDEKCSRCRRDAEITLRYAGQSLCRQHFIRFFDARVLRTVRKYRMLEKGSLVAVGLSGGKDSTVMLHLLCKISKSLPIRLVAITIDEGIAGYRPHTLSVAKRECGKLGVPLRVFSFKKLYGKTLDALLKEKGAKRACSFCGVMRRDALNRAAREIGADRLAIGHNADDVAQTVMMNYMRNEPERLWRFAPVSGLVEERALAKRIKPLFATPERDIAAYAMMKGIGVHFQECPYANSAFRQHVRSMLNATEEKYPATKMRIVRAFLSQLGPMQSAARKNLAKDGKGKIGRCGICGEPASGKGKTCSLCRMLKAEG